MFLDESGLDAGANWLHALEKQVNASAAMVALIGDGWADARDGKGSRRVVDVAEADRAFIEASAAEEDKRRSEEEERERKAQAEKLAASQRLVRRTVAGLAVALALAVIAGVLGVYAFTQQKAALTIRDGALLNQSQFLTRAAVKAIEEGNAGTGAVARFRGGPGQEGRVAKSRPRWA